jgi:hypothetical protein
MNEEYRKRGSVVRWENGRVISVTENGLAIEDGGRFECRPAGGERLSALDPARIQHDASSIQALAGGPVAIERLVIIEGRAEHRFGAAQWSDETRRVHLSLTHGHHRALLDFEDADLRTIESVARALGRCEPNERPSPPRLRLAPNVTAALLPALSGTAPPNVRLLQTGGGLDGKGASIEEAVAGPPWPNWYRPTYRIRPVKKPFNLRLECGVTEVDRDRPLALALLAPPAGLVARLLVEDGQHAYPVTTRITRIDAVSEQRVWYPYGAGSFGAEMML